MYDLEKMKELHNYEILLLLSKINCEYTNDELNDFMIPLNTKFGILNLDTSIAEGVCLKSYDLEHIEFIFIRGYSHGYETWEQYLFSTLMLSAIEMCVFRRKHYILKYTEEQIKMIFGKCDL